MKLSVKVIPSSSSTCVAGWLNDTLKIRVSAAPEKGKANQLIEKTLEKALQLPRNSVSITHGKTFSNKIIEIVSLSEDEVYRRLSKPGM